MELFNILKFAFTKATDILDIPMQPTWTPVVAVTIPAADVEAGVYMYGFAIQGTTTDTNDFMALRFSTNGAPWDEYIKENGDNDDTWGYTYQFPKVVDGTTDLSLAVEATKELNAQRFDINFADVWIQRVS